MKWRPMSWKTVPNVVLTSLIAGYLYLSFLSLHITCLLHSQSFQRFSPNLLQVLQPLIERCDECAIHHEQHVCEEQHPCGANMKTYNEHDQESLLLLGATNKERVKPTLLSIIATEITRLTRFPLLFLLQIQRYMWRNHITTWA